MGGAAKTVQNVAGKAIGAVVTGGTSLIPGSPTKRVGDVVGSALTLNPSGLKASLSGGGYTPTMLPQTDPTMQLAQSGGAPLLTQIALGANVDDAVAGYFGRTKGQDYDTWFNNLSPDQQAAVTGVKNQLTQIQTNTDLRNQAVQKVVNDYPNIVKQTAPAVAQAKQAAGEEFDAATKGYLDYANKAIAAKFGGTGTVSSGSAIQAANDAASKLGLERLQYTTDQGNTAFDRGATDLLGAWQQQYTEANALRGFQQKMLGQGASQGFSATQDALNRTQDTAKFNAGVTNQKAQADQAASNALLGSVGQFAGTAGLLALTHGMSAGVPSPSPAPTPTPTAGEAGYGAGGYR